MQGGSAITAVEGFEVSLDPEETKKVQKNEKKTVKNTKLQINLALN